MMMYTLWNMIFGWDYIYWKNFADQGCARVFNAKDGNVVYWRYKVTKFLDVIETPDQVIWLTCSPSKYFPLYFAMKYHEE